jgi:hypothetical protein
MSNMWWTPLEWVHDEHGEQLNEHGQHLSKHSE